MQFSLPNIIEEVKNANYLTLSKCISFLENQQEGSDEFCSQLNPDKIRIHLVLSNVSGIVMQKLILIPFVQL